MPAAKTTATDDTPENATPGQTTDESPFGIADDSPFAPTDANPFADDISLPPSYGSSSTDPFGAPDDDFDVDLSNVESRAPIPTGAYVGLLQALTKGTSSAGNPMWTWDYEIVDGEFKGRKLKNFTAMTPQALWKVQEALEAHGVSQENGRAKFKREDVVGTLCVLNIVLGEYEGRPQSRIGTVSAHPRGAGLRLKPANIP